MTARLITLSILTLLLAAITHAAFNLPPQITVSGRVDGGSIVTDVVQDGVATRTLPVITLTGAQYVNLTVGGTYTEQGANCTDAEDGAITVAAPVFSPALNVNAQGTYAATYTCTNTAPATVTTTRYVSVLPTQLAGWSGGPQSSTFAADNGFDFAETFDGLADWNQSSRGNVGNEWEVDAISMPTMPKLANGSQSAWGYYSSWTSVTSTHSWIGGTEGGTRQVWRGTKSASIDIGETAKGPSRLGLYLGEYTDVRVFYMVYIPKNQFPTSCEGGLCTGGGALGTYTEGLPYTWYSSWKFNTFNTGCGDVDCRGSGGPEGYGSHHMVPHIKQYSYTPNGLVITNHNNPTNTHMYGIDAGTTLDAYMSGWWGVEFRLKNNPTNTSAQLDVWTYAPDGTMHHVMRDRTDDYEMTGYGDAWDMFFFGGNNSNAYSWGPTMTSQYYIDDFIVDNGSKGPIGPRYFTAIAGE